MVINWDMDIITNIYINIQEKYYSYYGYSNFMIYYPI